MVDCHTRSIAARQVGRMTAREGETSRVRMAAYSLAVHHHDGSVHTLPDVAPVPPVDARADLDGRKSWAHLAVDHSMVSITRPLHSFLGTFSQRKLTERPLERSL